MILLRTNSISLRFLRLVGMVVMGLRGSRTLARDLDSKARAEARMEDHQMEDQVLAAVEARTVARTVARTLARKAQMVVQVPAAMETRTLALKAQMVVRILAAMGADRRADLDLANRVRLADHLEAHLEVRQVARVLAKKVHLETQDLAATEAHLVPVHRVMVNKAQMAVQGTAAMEVLLAARLLANKAQMAVQVRARPVALDQVPATTEAHLAARARAQAQAQAADPVQVPTAMARAQTPETALVHRTKGKAVP